MVFGRFGMGATQLLYWKENASFYYPAISLSGRIVLEWWAAMLRGAKPRRVISHNPFLGETSYKGAATETMIVSSVVFGKRKFDATTAISDAYLDVARGEWHAIISATSLIYG